MVRPMTAMIWCLFMCLEIIAGAAEAAPGAKPITYLNQGWTADERVQFYYTTQGSQLIPYDWFLALEQPDNQELLRADANMERLRFIPHGADPQRNPDAFPIGFVKDDKPRTVAEALSLKRSYLGKSYEQQHLPPSSVWLGLTCAACHTTELRHQGHTVRIDGGPALADAERFLEQLADSLEATGDDRAKMKRFAKRLLDATAYNETEENALRQRVQAYSKVLRQLVHRSAGTSPYGFGRLDAFGASADAGFPLGQSSRLGLRQCGGLSRIVECFVGSGQRRTS